MEYHSVSVVFTNINRVIKSIRTIWLGLAFNAAAKEKCIQNFGRTTKKEEILETMDNRGILFYLTNIICCMSYWLPCRINGSR